ncbi:carboxypeptidase-like regulatory domain-containing protein [Bacteroides sp. BFG-606]|nr:carboxypeptidase-like regulatory domain-containing protein [Bacteroides sp. BFG-606]MCS2335061.1 carboxypeptidase-like regulatory domain-containing protein [Bacteroides sp. BFG-606]
MNLFEMKKHRIRSLWLLLLLFTYSVTMQAQGSSVTGRISDEKGEMLIGVSVQEKGTTNGTITDTNGQYTLKLSTGNPILVISYIGYKPQEVKVGKQKVVDIVLVEDVSSLDEVVVVGYGNQRKVSVVGAQSSLDASAIKMPAAKLSSAISGRIAGVVAVQRSGEPGHDESDIWIRGISTLVKNGQSSSPLVLVDGVERSFNNIDPEDIESFTVLKDASATAVYGVRGANGVVIVKTKPGRISKPTFSVDYYESLTRMTKKVDMADAYTYMEARNEAQMNKNNTIAYSQAYIDATKKIERLATE